MGDTLADTISGDFNLSFPKRIGSRASLGQVALACREAGFSHGKGAIGGEGIGDIVSPVPSW